MEGFNKERTKEDAMKDMERFLEKIFNEGKMSFTDNLSARVHQLNEEYGKCMRLFIEIGAFDVSIEARRIHVKDPKNLEYLVFLPMVYPEISSMDSDDWFTVFSGAANEIGKLQYNGLPENNDPENVRLGYCMAYRPNEPVQKVEVEIDVKPRNDSDGGQ